MTDDATEPALGAFAALGALLRQEDPAGLAEITRGTPALVPALAEAKLLGEAPRRRGDAKLAQGYLELARTGLAAADRRAARLMDSLPRRLRAAKRLKLYGGILSAFSSAGVVSALALSSRIAALAGAGLGFLTSIVALVGEHMDSPLFGTRKSLGELTTELLDIEREIREQQLALLGLAERATLEGSLAAAQKVNALAARLRVLEVIEGLRAEAPAAMPAAAMPAGGGPAAGARRAEG